MNTNPEAQITSIQTKAHGLYEQRSDKSDMTNDKWIEEIAPSHKRRIYFLTKYLKTIPSHSSLSLDVILFG